jgi:competence protein ComEA
MVRVDRGKVVGRKAPTTPQSATQTTEPRPDTGINLNTATADELTAIKGVGKATARDIVAHRKKAGPFESLTDCAERVGGVSVEQLEAADAVV